MNNDDFDIKIHVSKRAAGLGTELLCNFLKDGQKAALFVGDDAPKSALYKLAWDTLYCSDDPAAVADFFILGGLTEYEDIAAFIDEHGGEHDADLIYHHVKEHLNAPPIEYSDEEPPF